LLERSLKEILGNCEINLQRVQRVFTESVDGGILPCGGGSPKKGGKGTDEVGLVFKLKDSPPI